MYKKILLVTCVLSSFSFCLLQGINSKQRKNKGYMARRSLYGQLRQKCRDFEKPAGAIEQLGAFLAFRNSVEEDRFEEIRNLFIRINQYGVSNKQIINARDSRGHNLLHTAVQHNSPTLVDAFLPKVDITEDITIDLLKLADAACPDENLDRTGHRKNIRIQSMLSGGGIQAPYRL